MAVTEVFIKDSGLSISNWLKVCETYLYWCDENCNGYYHFDVLPDSTRWIFDDETEAMAFKLRWT